MSKENRKAVDAFNGYKYSLNGQVEMKMANGNADVDYYVEVYVKGEGAIESISMGPWALESVTLGTDGVTHSLPGFKQPRKVIFIPMHEILQIHIVEEKLEN